MKINIQIRVYPLSFFTGEMEEAVQLCRNGIQVLKGSSMRLDDNKLEKMRIDLAELLHAVGRYLFDMWGFIYMSIYIYIHYYCKCCLSV